MKLRNPKFLMRVFFQAIFLSFLLLAILSFFSERSFFNAFIWVTPISHPRSFDVVTFSLLFLWFDHKFGWLAIVPWLFAESFTEVIYYFFNTATGYIQSSWYNLEYLQVITIILSFGISTYFMFRKGFKLNYLVLIVILCMNYVFVFEWNNPWWYLFGKENFLNMSIFVYHALYAGLMSIGIVRAIT